MVALLVPVKSGDSPKSRMSTESGTFADPAIRRQLADAFAVDAITAALTAELVSTVYIVGGSPAIPEHPRIRVLEDAGAGLNASLRQAAAAIAEFEPESRIAAMVADLPCLVGSELDEALARVDGRAHFVADADGTGTTLLIGPSVFDPPAGLDPHFGPDSARRHRDAGVVPIDAELPTLRCDVDTVAALKNAIRLGVGTATTQAVAKLNL